MKRAHWLIYLVTPDAQTNARVRIPRIIAIVFLSLAALGTLGFARCLWFLGSYGYAVIGVHGLERENANLRKTVRFLEKFTSTKEEQLAAVSSYENTVRLKYGMHVVNEDVRRAGVGGRPTSQDMLLASLEDPPVRQAGSVQARIEGLLREATLQDSTFSRMVYHVANQHELWARRPSIWPARGRITSGYGYRMHPFFKRKLFHEGLDIANRIWTPVFATADGIVSQLDYTRDWGNRVEIDHHGSGYSTMYAHLRQSTVVEGQVVRRGELIGYIGNSGRSTGPHLHYEVRKFNRHQNPMDYILPVSTAVD
ncbi:MAG: peptidoglycan DD-metalloendopeptidase family protein [Chitinivibrionales bacterium]|nr:peptidoglycan DD-metalloendopeptidase family protein [Chitinivibrionales bacterium]MBD3395155.1 peptidoglycan DD-metalloendopeptidase family protein [Chitinivibrionales bacterium]